MMHVALFTSAIPVATAFQQVAAINDVVLSVRDDSIIIPSNPRELNRVLSVLAFSAHIQRAQFQPPSMRNLGGYEIKPTTQAFSVSNAVTARHDFGDNPLLLRTGEELPAYMIHTNAAPEEGFIVGVLADELPAMKKAKYYTVRLTGATTLAPAAWTQVPLTFDQGLPAGDYEVVGARVESGTAVAFRFIQSNDITRPGGFCCTTAQAGDFPEQRSGRRGTWFKFNYLTPPTLEIVATSADTAQTVLLDIVPV